MNRELTKQIDSMHEEYRRFKAQGLKLNLTRGNPSSKQLDLCADLLALPLDTDYISEGGIDCRNYGGLQGIIEVRRLFSGIVGAPPEQVVVGNNSSLSLMHDIVTYSLLRGTCDGSLPWSQENGVSFLCPVPGYDRHFRICEQYGIQMIPVLLNQDGPEMDRVEQLVLQDPSIKGMWCVPKYSNPSGVVYQTQS